MHRHSNLYYSRHAGSKASVSRSEGHESELPSVPLSQNKNEVQGRSQPFAAAFPFNYVLPVTIPSDS